MERNHLHGSLEYTEKLLSLGERIVFDVTRELTSFPEERFLDHEAITLEDTGENWIRIKRLQETKAPQPDAKFEGWIEGDLNIPTREPALRKDRMYRMDREAVAELRQRGVLLDEDVLDPLKPDPSGGKDVILRLERMPDLYAEWEAYLTGVWNPWAELETPRRRVIDLYGRLYQIHQRIVSFGEDNPIELVMGVGVACWRSESATIISPIIEQPLETELEGSGSLLIRPRGVNPIINLKPFHALNVDSSEAVQRNAAAQLRRIIDDNDVTFSPFDARSFEEVLRLCVAGLSPKARYFPEFAPGSRSLPTPNEHLVVTDTWLVCARQRTEDIRRDDLKRLMAEVQTLEVDEQIPGCVRAFVRRPENKTAYTPQIDIGDSTLLPDVPAVSMRGIGGSHSREDSAVERSDGLKAIFFPLPFNDEQVEIITTLDRPETDGVVVQGPPGTGKTHTIANIICHSLALGKNVLVTAKTAEALRAVQEKLPDGIQKLAISVVHDDRDGARQLETAMTLLSNEAKQIIPRQTEDEIRTKQARLAAIKTRRSEVEAELIRIARDNLDTVVYRGRELRPMQLAEEVNAGRPDHSWFPDQFSSNTPRLPPFDANLMSTIIRLRTELGPAVIYPTDQLPDPAFMPPWADVARAHETLNELAEIENEGKGEEVPLLALDGQDSIESARLVFPFLDELDRLREHMATLDEKHWLRRVIGLGMRHHDDGEGRGDTAIWLLERWVELGTRGAAFHDYAVHVGTAVYTERELDEPIDNLAAGRKAFGWLSLGKSALKQQLDSVRVDGRIPVDPTEWSLVRECRKWHSEVDAFISDWNEAASRLRFFSYKNYHHAADILVPHRADAGRAASILRGYREHRPVVERLMPYGVDFDQLFRQWETNEVRRVLEVNLARVDASQAKSLRRDIGAFVRNKDLPFYGHILKVVEALGHPTVHTNEIARAWQKLERAARELHALKPQSARLDEMTSVIARSGAPNWARALRHSQGEHVILAPENWRESWEWAWAAAFIARLGDRTLTKRLSDEQATLEVEEKRLFAEVVRLRTFLGLKQKLTDSVQSALNKFTAAITKLGTGKNKSSPRYRRIIRNSTTEASEAIPCWIMPEWRVSEQLPSKLGMFDLVIVDEASQSDITALPAILRGKKLLVVGDDRQVSPSTVGIEERQIIQLRNTYLQGHPHADHMDPGSSLYDLASIVFPGKSIMLREHFRCVEPIIRFSSQFYQQPLIPLRIPKPSERLEPPLVDIFVEGGTRRRDINEAEAGVVVDEIRKIVADPEYDSRSIGVISLVGDKQAKRIHDLLLRELGPDTLQRHKLMCGNAATFQGQERDIIFLSMVECPESSTTKTSRVFAQRFNVAMSRARDRLVLVRSVDAAHLKTSDLKLKVIEHFRDPMKQGRIGMPADVLDLCDSEFEREVGRALLNLGYRIRPQVLVGGFKLDFAVEGLKDRRLAVECDGDQYHGPDRWPADMRRQKSLERMGWIFWRVWGSHWRSARDECIADLRKTLDRLGIEPLGATPPTQVWTEHRVVYAQGTEHPVIHAPEQDASASQRSEEFKPQPTAPGPDMVASIVVREPARRRPPEPVILSLEARSAPSTEVELPPSGQAAPVAHTAELPDAESRVQVGNAVIVRYVSTNKVRRLQISATENKPKEGIIWSKSPLGAALLGASVDDEVEYEAGAESHVVVVQSIQPQRDSVVA